MEECLSYQCNACYRTVPRHQHRCGHDPNSVERTRRQPFTCVDCGGRGLPATSQPGVLPQMGAGPASTAPTRTQDTSASEDRRGRQARPEDRTTPTPLLERVRDQDRRSRSPRFEQHPDPSPSGGYRQRDNSQRPSRAPGEAQRTFSAGPGSYLPPVASATYQPRPPHRTMSEIDQTILPTSGFGALQSTTRAGYGATQFGVAGSGAGRLTGGGPTTYTSQLPPGSGNPTMTSTQAPQTNQPLQPNQESEATGSVGARTCPGFSQDENDILLELRESGMSWSKIAAHFRDLHYPPRPYGSYSRHYKLLKSRMPKGDYGAYVPDHIQSAFDQNPGKRGGGGGGGGSGPAPYGFNPVPTR